MLKIGDTAPRFELPATDGKRVRLDDFKEKKVILFFYPKDDTPGCTKEACSFQENLAIIERKGAVVLGVSANGVHSHLKFSQKYGLQFPLLSDEKKDMIKAYGVWKEKSFLGKKYMGIERTTVIIDEEGIVKYIFPKVKVDGHTEEVLAVLEK